MSAPQKETSLVHVLGVMVIPVLQPSVHVRDTVALKKYQILLITAILLRVRLGVKPFKFVTRSGSPSVLQLVPPIQTVQQQWPCVAAFRASVFLMESTRFGERRMSAPQRELSLAHVLCVYVIPVQELR